MRRLLLGVLLLCVLAPAMAQWARQAIDGEQFCVRETGESYETGYSSPSWATAVCRTLNRVEAMLGGSLGEAEAALVIVGGTTGIPTPEEVAEDSEAPTTPQNLAVGVTTSTSAALSWSASTDNVGVSSYNIYRDESLLDTSATTSYTDTDADSSQVSLSGVLFDGESGYGTHTTAIGTLGDFTFSWWMQTETSAGGSGSAIAWGVIDTQTTDVVHVALNQDSTGHADDSVAIYVRGSVAHPTADSGSFTNAAVFDGTLRHHALRNDGGVTSYFVDGQAQSITFSLNAFGGTQDLDQPLAFGARNNAGAIDGFAAVNMREFVLYDMALSDVEIASLAGGDDPSTVQGDSRIRQWDLDGDGTESIASDTMTLSDAAFNQGHSYTVSAVDAADNESTQSTAVDAVIRANTAPEWVGVSTQNLSEDEAYSLDLSDFTTDPDANDTLTITKTLGDLPTGISFSDPTVSGTPTVAGEEETVTFRVSDGTATDDVEITFSVFTADVSAPPVPTGLTGTALSTSEIQWTWNASVDASGGAGELVSGTENYDLVLDGGAPITVSAAGAPTSHTQSGLTAGTSHTATIAARDAAGNVSAASSQVQVSTLSSGGGGDLSAPGVSGVIADEQIITISALGGESFGADGPVPVIYDDFKGCVHLQTISGAPFIGNRFAARPEARGYTSDSHSDNCSYTAIAGANQGGSQFGGMGSINYTWTGKHETILISYWMKFVTPYFPQANAYPTPLPPYTFHESSVWKFMWLLEDNGFLKDDGLSDIVIPSASSFKQLNLTGNTSSPCGVSCKTYNVYGTLADGLGNSNFAWDQAWQRLLAIHRRVGGSNPYCDPNCDQVYTQILSPYNGMIVTYNGALPSWIGGSGGFNGMNTNTTVKQSHPDSLILQDDIYIAGGDGAAARVEITDGVTYGASTDSAWCIVTSWATSQVQCRLKAGPFADLSGKYIHIHNASNQHTNGGNGRLIQ